MLVLAVLAGSLCVAFEIQKAEGIDCICIEADGSVYPLSAPISTEDYVTYTFTGDITNRSVVVERDNIVINGAGHTIQGPGMSGSAKGLDLWGRENITVMNLEIKTFTIGIGIHGSSNVFIYGNNITANAIGIKLEYFSKSNTISGNHITDNHYGIGLADSSGQVLCENVISNNSDCGIDLVHSSNSIMYGNVISNSPLCLWIWGNELGHFMHSIDASNLVNDKPVYYLVNQTDLVLNNTTHPQVGCLALVNCMNITVEGLRLADTALVLMLAYTSNSTIMNNTITNSTAQYWSGVLLQSSYNNTFAGNNITNFSNGIWLEYSYCNILSANSIMNNTYSGVSLYLSHDNLIAGNDIADNGIGINVCDSCTNNRIYENNITRSSDCGIYLYDSSNNSIYDNSIYHNSFADNTAHVKFMSCLGVNLWDDGYPSGGNYWSGYSDTDMYSGPYQNETGSDGIWDHPYVINDQNQDNYPTVPEYSASLMLLVPMSLAFVTVAVYKKKKTGTTQSIRPS
jgi:parallel beta-helix repeat protein